MLSMRTIKTLCAGALVALIMPVAANATLVLTPSTTTCGSSPCLAATGNETAQPDINDAIAGFLLGDDEVYKQNVGDGFDTGSAAGWYTTTFFNSPSDPSEATIVWDGGSFLTDASYLLVKNGAQDPAWYLFDISSWDGQETISLIGFWPENGAISHVTIYAGEGDDCCRTVPEPGPLGLLGGGLVVLYFIRRRRFLS